MELVNAKWIDAARGGLARLRRGSDAAKIAVAVALLGLAGLLALTAGPRRPKPLADILTIVSNNDVERARAAVDARHAALREVDLDGNTPLHIAAMLGSREMVDVLLAAGADVAVRNRHGWTPLVAVLNGGGGNQAGVAEALIAAGASRDERLPGGETLLHLAASVPGVHPKLVAVIADGPAAADARNDAGETPLQVAERHGRPKIVAALRRLRGQASGLGAGGN